MAAEVTDPVVPAEPVYLTSVSPSGIETCYSPAPRRHYKVRDTSVGNYEDHGDTMFFPTDWQEVPSVTTVLDVLNKPLSYWGNKIGADGVLELVRRGLLRWEA